MELNPATIGVMCEVEFSTRSVRFGWCCAGLEVSQGFRALGVAWYTFRLHQFHPQGGDLGDQTRCWIRGLVGGSQMVVGHHGLHTRPVTSLL